LEVVIEPAVMVELWEQLLVRKRELDEWESALLFREHGVVEAKHALRRAHMECDVAHDRAGAVRQDYHARLCASIAYWRRSLEFNRVLSGRQFILSVQEINLERQEKELNNDQARGLYPPDGRNLWSELGKLHERMAEVEDDHAVEAKQLSRSTMEISNALVNLNVLPI
jgi:hypothetical protein